MLASLFGAKQRRQIIPITTLEVQMSVASVSFWHFSSKNSSPFGVSLVLDQSGETVCIAECYSGV